MANEFSVIFVSKTAYELSKKEDIGSKTKFWFEDEKLGWCLYKQSKQNLGEDWAEKVAAELSELLGLPHAFYKLAETWEGNHGVISPSFLPEKSILVHGNELLSTIVPDYNTLATYGATQHTIDNVRKVFLRYEVDLPLNWTALKGINKAVDVFIGYLLLDAWIGNGDRHHQNWGFVQQISGQLNLAPTYDHASCLGRELSDEKRHRCDVKAYTNKCYSAFYNQESDKKTLKNCALFQKVADDYPQSAQRWLEVLADISTEKIREIFERIPNSRISPIAAEFAQKILTINKNKLLELGKV